ncbi:MAG: hypothetical protein CVT94_13480 [Bacteroidetes bacterium HGW-Bacteroidetes-11]|jgi:hypothetical protein|nr:MAG: hypothetical protein CVT94_13480 [Bacteroidetes bacterium HGW-Bacteroidetes-11]
MTTISSDSTWLRVGTVSVRKENILFLDRDQSKVYIILSGRTFGSMRDDNNISIPFAQAQVADHDPFTSAEELQLHIETM